jgi:DNA-binding transcriptional MerR regulator
MTTRKKPVSKSRRTVKELAQLSGVSTRTLHFYDQIGLLKPASIGENGYRYYGQEELLLLQQILFFRKLGLPLAEIQRAVSDPAFDRVATLRAHRERKRSKRSCMSTKLAEFLAEAMGVYARLHLALERNSG